MSDEVIIRTPYKNPRHAVPEDFSLIPSCTETEGYESIEDIMRKLVSHRPISSSMRPLSDGLDLQDEAIEDVFQKLSVVESLYVNKNRGETSEQAKTSETPTAAAQRISEVVASEPTAQPQSGKQGL